MFYYRNHHHHIFIFPSACCSCCLLLIRSEVLVYCIIKKYEIASVQKNEQMLQSKQLPTSSSQKQLHFPVKSAVRALHHFPSRRRHDVFNEKFRASFWCREVSLRFPARSPHAAGQMIGAQSGNERDAVLPTASQCTIKTILRLVFQGEVSPFVV